MNTGIDIDKSLTTLRIVIASMIAGLLTFGTVAAVIPVRATSDPFLTRVLLVVLACAGVSELPLYALVRGVFVRKLRRAYQQRTSQENPTAQLVPGMVTLTLIGAAMAEAFGILGLVVFLVARAAPALAAPAIALLLLAILLPSRGRLARFVESVTGRYWS